MSYPAKFSSRKKYRLFSSARLHITLPLHGRKCDIQMELSKGRNRVHDTTFARALVIIAWILLVLNIWAMLINPYYARVVRFRQEIAESTPGYTVQLGMLASAIFALAMVTWLEWRHRYRKTEITAATIIIVLSITFLF